MVQKIPVHAFVGLSHISKVNALVKRTLESFVMIAKLWLEEVLASRLKKVSESPVAAIAGEIGEAIQ